MNNNLITLRIRVQDVPFGGMPCRIAPVRH